MLRKWISVLLVLVLSVSVLAVSAAEEETDPINYQTLGDPGFTEVYVNDFIGLTWRDDMLLTSSLSVKPEIAKVSAALSAAAYSRDQVCTLLGEGGMGFRVIDNGSSYGSRTIDDNDHVAYTIASKEIPDGQTTYKAYCVAIRGTIKAEWFSDFNLGKDNGGNHAGFYSAAQELWNELQPILTGFRYLTAVMFVSGVNPIIE